MSDQLRSLKDIWNEAGQQPVVVATRACNGQERVFHLVGFSPKGQAVGWDVATGQATWYWDSERWVRK